MFYWYSASSLNSSIGVSTLTSLSFDQFEWHKSQILTTFKGQLSTFRQEYINWIFAKDCLYLGHCNCNLMLVNYNFSFINPVANYCQVTKNPNLALHKKMWIHFRVIFPHFLEKFLNGTKSRPHT